MPYCSKCGVEVDEFVDVCPLCKNPIQKFSGKQEIPAAHYPEPGPEITKKKQALEKHNIYMAWMIISVVLFTPFFVILTIGIQAGSITSWAAYPLASMIAAWMITTILLFFIRKPVIYSTGILITLAALLFSLDFIHSGKLTWFLPLGLPILFLLYILTLIVVIASIKVKEKGLNIGGFILVASGFFCIGLDMLFSVYFKGSIIPGWSFVAVSSIFPLAIFFLLLHYILKKKVKFKRFFHM
jgi:hypothetical protein